MLVFDTRTIGNNLLAIRKKTGLTQAELAEKAGLSDRTYADIERGETNMRVETLLRICRVLKVTPDHVLTCEETDEPDLEQLLAELKECPPKERETAMKLLLIYLDSLN